MRTGLKNLIKKCPQPVLYQITKMVSPRASQKLIVLALGRTGGTTLLKLLGSHPKLRYLDEPLIRRVNGPSGHIQNLAAWENVRGRAFACKIKHWHITRVQKQAEPERFLVDALNNGWTIIRLKRENYVKQAIAGLLRVHGEGPRYHSDSGVRVFIPLEEIIPAINRRIHDASIEDEIAGRLLLPTLSYERDILDSLRRQEVCNLIFTKLRLTDHNVSDVTVRTESDVLADHVLNYDEVLECLHSHDLSYEDDVQSAYRWTPTESRRTYLTHSLNH